MNEEVKVYLGIIVTEYDTKKVKILASNLEEAEKTFNDIASVTGAIVEDVMEV